MQTPSQHKICPRCQTPTHLTAQVCQQCGRQFRTQFVDQTQVVTPFSPSPMARPNGVLISLQWVSVAVMGILFAERLWLYAVLAMAVGLFAAIALLISRQRADKINGVLYLVLFVLGWVLLFANRGVGQPDPTTEPYLPQSGQPERLIQPGH